MQVSEEQVRNREMRMRKTSAQATGKGWGGGTKGRTDWDERGGADRDRQAAPSACLLGSGMNSLYGMGMVCKTLPCVAEHSRGKGDADV